MHSCLLECSIRVAQSKLTTLIECFAMVKYTRDNTNIMKSRYILDTAYSLEIPKMAKMTSKL